MPRYMNTEIVQNVCRHAWLLRYIYVCVCVCVLCHVIMSSSFSTKETDFILWNVILNFVSYLILTFEMSQHYTYIIYNISYIIQAVSKPFQAKNTLMTSSMKSQ